MADDAFEAKLRQLADRFLIGLPADLARLRAAIGGGDAADVVGGILHRIVGRAGSFGFPGISDQAAQLETLVLDGRWLEGGSPSTAFEARLGELEALAGEAIGRRK